MKLFRRLAASVAVLVIVPLAVPSSADPTVSVHLASGPSPFAGCDDSGQLGTNTVNAELEPSVAVNPTDPDNIVAVFQQDRWSNGAAHGVAASVSHDGGATWTTTFPHLSLCAGGTVANGGDFQRASDPWVTFSPDGTAYFMALALSFYSAVPDSAMLVARSTDGGDTWSEPTTLARDPSDPAPFFFHDKNAITADPLDARYVYAVWDRSRFKNGSASENAGFNTSAARADVMFARTTDGGASWGPARAVYQSPRHEWVIGNQVAVLPDGTLVDIFDRSKGSGNNFHGYEMSVIRSTDHGETWSGRITVAPELAVGSVDPETGVPIREGGGLPDVAADLNPASPGYGNLYAVWGDSFGSGKVNNKSLYENVVFTMSSDGGLTWSPLAHIDMAPHGVQAFTPMIDVAADGTVGVSYYDNRSNTPAPGFLTDAWFIRCATGADCTDRSSWVETHLFGPFDIERAPVARGYFLGDYEGLTSTGNDFLAFFSAPTDSDPDNGYLARVTP